MSKLPITQRQAEALAVMVDYFHRNDQLPTLEALAAGLGVTQHAARRHFEQLRRRGHIERNESGKYRFTRDRVLQTTKFKPQGWQRSLKGNVIPPLPNPSPD